MNWIKLSAKRAARTNSISCPDDFLLGVEWVLEESKKMAFNAQESSFSKESATISCYQEKFLKLNDLLSLFYELD